MDWVNKLSEEVEKHKAILVIGDLCLACNKNDKLCKPVVIKTRLNFAFLPDHKSIMTILCESCAEDPPTTWKLVNNIVKKLVEQNADN